MTGARLPSRLLVDLLIRSTTVAGGFAMLLARGDDHGGTLLIQCRNRDEAGPLLERQFDGLWREVGPGPDAAETEQAAYVARRRKVDPDLWLVELDIPEAPRFIAELTAGG